MAVKKKATKRKTGAKKRKSRVGAAASPATITVNGKRYTKKMCSLTKTDAKTKAKNFKAKGAKKFAVVRPNTAGKGHCLYTRG